MMKKILSMLLVLTMLMCSVPVFADDTAETITVYITMSQYGEIVKDKNGNDMAFAPVTLNGKDAYTLSDAFCEAHRLYYPEGEDGFASSESEWGISVDKIWGDTSYNFGYQINRGQTSVMGGGHILSDGDRIDATIYKNQYPESESYSRFDSETFEGAPGDSISLNLTCVSGYDDSWNMIFSPCADAVITVNGEETEFVTDENGNVSISLYESGKYIISAKKTRLSGDEAVPAITAPVFVATIINSGEEPSYCDPVEIMHNIALGYADVDPEADKSNLPWIVADMAVYAELFPESGNVFSEEKKEELLSAIVDGALAATTPGDMAKSIIALCSLGYDAKSIYTEDYEKEDIVEKLSELVDEEDDAVTNIYTLPYVAIALSQDEDYATSRQLKKLADAMLDSKDLWLNTDFGTDALTPMILALSPYYSTDDEVKTAVDEAVEVLKQEQREDGLIDGYEGYEPASTGLAMCGLSAIGINPNEIVNGQKSLTDGLLSSLNDEQNGFTNAFATEQGFRGLLAMELFLTNGEKRMYDFIGYTKNAVNMTDSQYCPVIFEVSPSSAEVKIDDEESVAENVFDLEAGEYKYKVSKSGYKTKTETITITDEQAQSRTPEIITVSLEKSEGGSNGGGGVYTFNEPDTTVAEAQNQIAETVTNQSGDVVMTGETFPDVAESDWYYPTVKYVYENNLFKGTEKGFEPNSPMTRAMLVSVLHRLDSPSEKASAAAFADVSENMWYFEGVSWACQNGIVNGITDTEFAPDANITREQIAVILYRFAEYKKLVTSASAETAVLTFADADDISSYASDAMRYAVDKGIISGRSENTLAPKGHATRAEVATMLMRFDEVIKK